jgi:toxin ParE1/3/4
MKLRYTRAARDHIEAIYDYIRERNPAAATQVVARIRLAAERVCQFPHIGHLGAVSGTYEWVVKDLPYILVFEVDEDNDEIIVLGVFHGPQNRGRRTESP